MNVDRLLKKLLDMRSKIELVIFCVLVVVSIICSIFVNKLDFESDLEQWKKEYDQGWVNQNKI